MDTTPKPFSDDAEAERLFMRDAVQEALADPRPGIPHDKMQKLMLHEIAKLEAKILADTGTLDFDQAELFYKTKAVTEARQDPRTPVANDIVCAAMLREIDEIDREIAARLKK